MKSLLAALIFMLVIFNFSMVNAEENSVDTSVPSTQSTENTPPKTSNDRFLRQSVPRMSMRKDTKWDNLIIPVCWENANAKYEDGMQRTKDSVLKTWQANSMIKFTGWGQCYSNDKGIRIVIEDESDLRGPSVKYLGKKLDGVKNGMLLNFTFKHWSTDCQGREEYCIRSIAVHEFGHALGFTHEQNRPDASQKCSKQAQGDIPDLLLTENDERGSTMSYCNLSYNNNGQLSPNDLEGLHKVYGLPSTPSSGS